jgi:NAD(P)-dependent dehydrogenase (short-subunit alcohol dehydrogenase family)
MDGFLSGKVAVVTGAGRGIGRAEAIALAQAGASVIVNDLGVELSGSGESQGPADEVVAEIIEQGGRAAANYESVADFAGAGRIVQQAIDTFGRLDILVNNAGILGPDTLDEHSPEEFNRVISIHLGGTFNTCKHAVPHMKAQNYGRIINTVSNAWNLPTGRVGYAAAKGVGTRTVRDQRECHRALRGDTYAGARAGARDEDVRGRIDFQRTLLQDTRAPRSDLHDRRPIISTDGGSR